jgi:hypothetical protein
VRALARPDLSPDYKEALLRELDRVNRELSDLPRETKGPGKEKPNG